MKHGDYVETPNGSGRVVFVRMAPPTYTEPEAVSVLLDAYKHRADYVGTTFLAAAVKKVKEAPAEW